MRRILLTPRWLALHALAIVLVIAFLKLGWWQLQRGVAGNGRSLGYALEWPAFAIFVVVMWVKMIRDEARPPDAARDDDAGSGGMADHRTTSPVRAGHTDDDEEEEEPDEDLAAYNRYLAWLNANAVQQRR